MCALAVPVRLLEITGASQPPGRQGAGRTSSCFICLVRQQERQETYGSANGDLF